MTKKTLSQLLLVAFVFGFSLDADAQFWKKKKPAVKTTPKPKPKPKKGAIQPYGKVVTKKHKTDEGLFKVHTKDETYLFEIPDSLLKREMLMVTRIAKNTSNNGSFGGQKTNTQVLRWQKKNKSILLRIVSHNIVADEDLPVHEAVVPTRAVSCPEPLNPRALVPTPALLSRGLASPPRRLFKRC